MGIRLRGGGENIIKRSTVERCVSGVTLDDSTFNRVESVTARDDTFGISVTNADGTLALLNMLVGAS